MGQAHFFFFFKSSISYFRSLILFIQNHIIFVCMFLFFFNLFASLFFFFLINFSFFFLSTFYKLFNLNVNLEIPNCKWGEILLTHNLKLRFFF